jgi:Flp pilus assembly pilin Flp
MDVKAQAIVRILKDGGDVCSHLPSGRTRIMTDALRRFISDEGGQDIIEYGLLASFISIVAVLTVKAIGPFVLAMYQAIVTAMTP